VTGVVLVKALFIGIVFVCLSGCGLRQESSMHTVTTVPVVQGAEFPVLTQEELARLHDLSFPLRVEPRNLLMTDAQMVFSYTTELSEDELITFYHAQMDYLGWEEQAVVKAPESCLMFTKPSKLCTITLRSDGALRRVTLFITLKQ
jgi:hypothetical protein